MKTKRDHGGSFDFLFHKKVIPELKRFGYSKEVKKQG